MDFQVDENEAMPEADDEEFDELILDWLEATPAQARFADPLQSVAILNFRRLSWSRCKYRGIDLIINSNKLMSGFQFP